MGGLDPLAGAGVEASLLYDGKPARIFCKSVISATLGIFMDGRGAVVVGLVEDPAGIEADELDANGRPAPSLPEGKADDEAVFLKLGNAFFDASADVDDGPVPGTEFFFASSFKWSKLLTAFSISSFLDNPMRSVSCFFGFLNRMAATPKKSGMTYLVISLFRGLVSPMFRNGLSAESESEALP
jgi:hypothetical protein